MPATRAQRNRAVRQDALREQLAAKGLVQHVLEISEKLSDPRQEIDALMVQRYRVAIDAKLKLVSKYLPDVKTVEIEGSGGGPVITKTVIELVRPKDPDA